MHLDPLPFGNYFLLERLAIGGMAEVYLSKSFGSRGTDQLVALKRILPTIAEDDDFIAMFIDEAKIAGQLHHDNIASIFDLGKINESYFIAMEYVSGHDIRTLWDRANERNVRLPIALCCHVVRKICEALDYAHRRRDPRGRPLGIIHRDVSPQNILISYEGVLKVIDFGIAKAANRMVRTQTGILKGKFAYMAPEQARGEPTDHRADIFAIGVILYELLTGQRAFKADSDFALLEKVRKVEIVPPRKYNRDVPKALSIIVYKAMAQKPTDRYGWASDFAEELKAFQEKMELPFSDAELSRYLCSLFTEELQEEQRRLKDYRAFKSNAKPVKPQAKLNRETVVGEGDTLDTETTQFVSREELLGQSEHAQVTQAKFFDSTRAPSQVADASSPWSGHELISNDSASIVSETHTPAMRPSRTGRHGEAKFAKESEVEEAKTEIGAPPLSQKQERAQSQHSVPHATPVTRERMAQAPLSERSPQPQMLPNTTSPSKASATLAPMIWTGALAFFLGALAAFMCFMFFFGQSKNLVLLSEPTGAEVFLGGKKICESTPCLHGVDLGQHEFLFETALAKHKLKVEVKNRNVHIAKATLREQRDVPLVTTPPGALVSVDGVELGETPLVLKSLGVGDEVELQLKKEGFVDVNKMLAIPKSGEVAFSLASASTNFVIKAKPNDARLSVGKASATQNLKVSVVQGAPQSLLVRRPGCVEKAVPLLATGEALAEREVILDCPKLTATLDVTSALRSSVTIDGIDIGQRTPLRNYRLPPGQHSVRVTRRSRSATFLVTLENNAGFRLDTKFR